MRTEKRRRLRAESDGRRPGKFRRALHALSRAVLLLLLTAAAIVMMTIFFKVNTISVEGAEKYSVEEITNALDISKGDNLYLWNKMKVQEHLLEKLPYLDSVRIRRHLPDALVLTVTECPRGGGGQGGGRLVLLHQQHGQDPRAEHLGRRPCGRDRS